MSPRKNNFGKIVFAFLSLVTLLSSSALGADNSYDGGQPTHPKDLKGKKIVLADVPKLIGIGYFAATTKGEAEAATELTKNGLPTHRTAVVSDPGFASASASRTCTVRSQLDEARCEPSGLMPSDQWKPSPLDA